MTALEPAQLLDGKYRIERLVGVGAWGEVFEAVNVRIKRRVAIKVLKPEYASNAQMVARFEREALASTHIESPHVVQVLDAGLLPDGRPYLVMEFLTGQDLSQVLQLSGGTLPVVTAVELCMQAARGLAAAHAAGIFHRDMKPSNIVIAKTKSGHDIAKIVDFGISKLLDTSDQVSTTQTGVVLGSPLYMSPEQARGAKTTDQRSDVYSLGVVLYECLTGQPPHATGNIHELLFKIVLEPIPSAKTLRPEVDDELDAILQAAMAKDAERRYQSAVELETALVEWLVKHGRSLADLRLDLAGRERMPSLVGDLSASPVVLSPRGVGASPVLASPQGLGDLPRTPVPHPSEPRLAGVNATLPVALAKPSTPEALARSPVMSHSQTDGAVAATVPVPGVRPATHNSSPPVEIVAVRSRWIPSTLAAVGVTAMIGLVSVLALRGNTPAAGVVGPSVSAMPAEAPPVLPSPPVMGEVEPEPPVPPVSEPSPSASAVEEPAPRPIAKPPLRPVVVKALGVPSAPASAAPAPSAPPPPPTAQPATTVGGRRIHTDL